MSLTRRMLILALVGMLLASAASTAVEAAPDDLTIALIGDIPYGQADEPKYINLIKAINNASPAFTIHDGDIKSGSTLCSDEMYEVRLQQFGYFEHPVVYVFGDNEWTDCHRANNGAYDPLERLAKLRAMFTVGDASLGQRTMPLDRESNIPQYATFRENVRWSYADVLFVGLHIVGSNNNLGRTPEADAEFYERNEANLAWLWQSFAIAQKENARAVMLIMQANPGFELPVNDPRRAGYESFLSALEQATIAFGKPVVLVHGDSHYFRIDKPMIDSATEERVQNFTRVETFGEQDVHWVRAHIVPSDPNVFTFEQMLVPENLP